MSTPVERFQELLRIPTISRNEVELTDWAQFAAFRDTLARLYPAAHAALELEVIAEHSLLYRWKGSETGEPTVLMAHYDVVPATDEGWEHPAFGAEIVDGTLYARGSIDNKGSLIAIFESIETLAAEGFVPRTDVYIFAGHNEETAGDGAELTVAILRDRDIHPALVLDEGGAIVEGVFPSVTKPSAVIGVSEKGILTLVLTVDQVGGHASTPPRFSATARLARAIVRLTKKPFPARMSRPTVEMVETLGAHASGALRLAFTNTWITKPLLVALFSRLSDETSAMVRTTAAVTRLSGSAGSNVLAESATAAVNIRVAVGSSVAEAVAHVQRAVRDDRVSITVEEASEPSPVSPTTGEAWEMLSHTIVDVFPGTIVTPYIQLGASDSRHFTAISDHVYRFTPFELSAAQRATLHARNENITVATWLRGIAFYEKLVRSL